MAWVKYLHLLLLDISQQLLKNGTVVHSLAQYKSAQNKNKSSHVSEVQCDNQRQSNATDFVVLLKHTLTHVER